MKTPVEAAQDVLGTDVKVSAKAEWGGLPLVIEAHSHALTRDVDVAVGWIGANQEAIDALMVEVGAVVLRGFAVPDTAAFNRAIEAYPNMEFGYRGGAAPRTQIAGRTFEATQAAPHLKLPLHQEMCYLPDYPKKLAFYCAQASETGGETLIGDVRRFERGVPSSYRDALERRGIRYVRNFRAPDWSTGDAALDTLHRPWTAAFSTEDPASAEADCRAMGLEFEWVANGSLSVIYNAKPTVNHPVTGRSIWFNQLHGYVMNKYSYTDFADKLERSYPKGTPRAVDSTFGDGGPVIEDEVGPVWQAQVDVEVASPWRNGDMMIVDNFHTFHGRSAFTGKRNVQVALLG